MRQAQSNTGLQNKEVANKNHQGPGGNFILSKELDILASTRGWQVTEYLSQLGGLYPASTHAALGAGVDNEEPFTSHPHTHKESETQRTAPPLSKGSHISPVLVPLLGNGACLEVCSVTQLAATYG